MSRRFYPNIIITGTPGCGKSSHASSLISELPSELQEKFAHFPISEIAKKQKFIDSYDESRDTSVVDDDKLLDYLEPILENGGAVVDWHCCEIFPERLIDLVVVLRTDNKKLYQRLSKRGYKESKIQENIDCEIMEVIPQEAREAYVPEILIELNSNNAEELDDNVERVSLWIKQWIKDHAEGVSNKLEVSTSDSDESE